MKLLHSLAAAVSAAVLLASLPAFPARAALRDSGMTYTESTETINNPGAGYTSTLWYVCKPGDTPVKNPTGNLVLMFVDIGAFSSGINGTTDEDGNYTEGIDYNLDDAFFAGMRGTLANCRKNGCTVALRFRYDANGKTNPEPASFEQLLHHIDQIKADGFLEDYKDILMYVECGFVGAWGEQHSGKYTSLEYKARLLEAVLAMTPDDIPVTVRTPNIFRQWQGLDMDGMAAWVSEPGSQAARVGLYNDGYMGSDSDLGTYSDRAVETAWLGRQTVSTYYGGEFSGNLEWAQKYDTYLPEHAVPEMYATHLSYINANIYQLYKDYTFSASCDVPQGDHSAYYGETVFKFVRDHLGYRFVVRDCDLSGDAVQGGTFDLDFDVENTGFANPIRPQNAELLLEKDGYYYAAPAGIDSRTWRSCETASESLHVQLPGRIQPGEWNVYLRLSVGEQDPEAPHLRTVQFANPDVWNISLGANLLGSIRIAQDPAAGTQTLSVNGLDAGRPRLYSVNDRIIFDGQRSSASEWTGKTLIGDEDGKKLYIARDGDDLYIAAEIAHGTEQPVWNVRFDTDAGESYWCYWQNAGWMYYNKSEDHNGIAFKRSADFAEFRFSLSEAAGIAGTAVTKVRVFVQDEPNGWANAGDITAECSVPLTPAVYGDLNADGRLDAADAAALQMWLMHYRIAISGDADFNCDGTWDIFDLAILKHLLQAKP